MKTFLNWAGVAVVVIVALGFLAFLYVIPPFFTTPPEVFSKLMAEAPPGAGFTTVTDTVPAWAMSAAVMAAVSWVSLTTVVVRLAPFHCTAELGTKFAPVTSRAKAGPPAVVLAGVQMLGLHADWIIG